MCKIFNYHFSRARRIMKNTFGILVARCRIFRKPIKLQPENAEKLVTAAIALCNYVRQRVDASYIHSGSIDCENDNGDIIPGQWRDNVDGNIFQCVPNIWISKYSNNAIKIREELVHHLFTNKTINEHLDRRNALRRKIRKRGCGFIFTNFICPSQNKNQLLVSTEYRIILPLLIFNFPKLFWSPPRVNFIPATPLPPIIAINLCGKSNHKPNIEYPNSSEKKLRNIGHISIKMMEKTGKILWKSLDTI